MSVRSRRNLEKWVSDEPRGSRWIRQCAACGSAGMAADAPQEFYNRFWVERLGSIRLDESGLCEDCAAARERTRG